MLKPGERRQFAPKGPAFLGDSFIMRSVIVDSDRFLSLLSGAAEKGAAFGAMQVIVLLKHA